MQETATYKKFKNSPQNNFPEFIIIHHSAASADQTVKSIEDYHLSLGWDGVGYQYLITKQGEIWKGRPEIRNGAHTSEQKMNTRSIGICVIGDFDKNMPTSNQVFSLTTLLKDITTRYPKIQIKYHRDFNPKSCPGSKISNTWASDLLKIVSPVIEMVSIPKSLAIELKKYL